LEVKDWQFRNREQAISGARTWIESVRPRDIVLLHDDNPFVLDVLDEVLPALGAMGMDVASGARAMGG
jgi:hypothetical protein